MSLPDLVVRRPVTTSMFFIAIVLFGLFSLGRLAIDLIPEISMPSLNISSSYSGVAPEEIERAITIPIEQAVSSVSGVTGMESTSREGSSWVTLRFDWGKDLEAATDEVRASLDRVRSRLPDGASAPQVRNFDPSQMPIMTIAIGGDMDPADLRRLAEQEFTYYLERLDGVAAISVAGGRSQEILVKLDTTRLQAYGLTVDQVVQAIRAENFNIPAGRVVVGEAQYTLRSYGELESAEELGSILVARRNNMKTYLADIAEIEVSGEDGGMIVRVDGQPGITLSIQKQSGANTVQVADAVYEALEDLRMRYPEMNIRAVNDSSIFIRQSVNNVVRAGLFGALLAALLLFLFMHSLRLTAIIVVAIPVSFIASFILIERAGMTLNLMSLGGLALGVGMLVDNSIVVLENIFRHLKGGESARTAAIAGTKEMTTPIVASTLTTLAVFLPMMFVSGMTGILFRQLSMMVAFSISCSLVVALTLLPVMSAHLLHQEGTRKETGFFVRIGRTIERRLMRVEEGYGRFAAKAVHRPGVVVGLSVAVFIGSLLLIPLLGTELMPTSDEGALSVRFSLPSGTKLETTDAMAREIEAIIRQDTPELESMDVRVGSGGGRGTNSGSVSLVLVPRGQRERSTDEVVTDLRELLAKIPGISFRIRANSNFIQRMAAGSFGGGDERISLYVQGYQLPLIRQTAAELVRVIQDIPGVINASVSRDSEQPEFVVHIDRERVADLGLSANQVANTVQAAVQGRTATQLMINDKEYPVRVALAGSEGMQPAEIEALPLAVGGGQYVPLKSVGTLVVQDSPETVQRLNQQRSVRITASPDGRDLGSVVEAMREAIYGYGLPDGVMVYFGGEYEEQQRAFGELLMVLLLAVALVYAVMASQFESLFDPLLVMFSIPFALVGVILTLFLTETPLTTQAFMGLIMLGGIVVNNAIVLISYINLLREQGMALGEAVIQGARTRLRPILLTTGSTALGLLPMALELGEGSEIQAPLARTVIGGLLVASAVTLVLIPTIYQWAHGIGEKRRARKAGSQVATVSIILAVTILSGAGFAGGIVRADEALPHLTIEGAIERAFGANPRIESGEAKLNEAQSKLQEAEATYRLRLALDSDWDLRWPVERQEYGFSQQRTVGFQLRKVFPSSNLSGRQNEQIQLAKLTVATTEGELADIRSAVVISVLEAYIDLINANAQLDQARYTEKQAAANLEMAVFRFGQGMISSIDLQQAEAQLSTAKMGTARGQNNKRLALARLNKQIGADPFTQWQVDDVEIALHRPLLEPLPGDEPPKADLIRALERFQVQQVRNQLLRAEITAAARIHGDTPFLTVAAGVADSKGTVSLGWDNRSQDTTLTVLDRIYSFSDGALPGGTSQMKDPYWELGLSLTWPLYDGGVEAEKTQQEESLIEQLRKQVVQQEQLVTLEVYDCYYGLQETRMRAEISMWARDTALERFQLTKEMAELGTVTPMEVLESEIMYLQADQSKLEAVMAAFLADARYLRASGQSVRTWLGMEVDKW